MERYILLENLKKKNLNEKGICVLHILKSSSYAPGEVYILHYNFPKWRWIDLDAVEFGFNSSTDFEEMFKIDTGYDYEILFFDDQKEFAKWLLAV